MHDGKKEKQGLHWVYRLLQHAWRDGYKCGLGFEVIEDIEGGYGTWNVVVHPLDNLCNSIELPTTKEEFVEVANRLGIKWNIDEVAELDDIY